MKRVAVATALCALVWASGCSLGLDPPPSVVLARFDPDAQVVPMPNDVLRDKQTGLLALPTDGANLSDAEKQMRGWLNQLDGWPTTLAATVQFTAPVDPATVDDSSVQVWRWGDVPVELGSDVVPRALDHAGQTLTLTAPDAGWDRGATYVVIARGGTEGLRGASHQPVDADAAFYFLRLTERLDDPMHERAFPGDTRDERMANGAKLEAIREDLVPYFDFFESRGIPRSEVASLWRFTPTTRTELAMDVTSQRMPLPFDLLIDRTTGRIAIPSSPKDSAVEAEGKRRLNEYDGWGLSSGLMFETTAPVGAVTDKDVELYEASDPPTRLDVTLKVHTDQMHIEVTPKSVPLKEGTTYGLVVRDTFVDAQGRPIIPMTIGQFMRTSAPIATMDKSNIGGVADEDAARVEWTRQRITKLLDAVGRDHAVTAWPYTTQTVFPRVTAAIAAAAAIGPAAKPENLQQRTTLQALGDFPLNTSLLSVGNVYYGTLKMPSWLDDKTRDWHADGTYAMRDVGFTLTVPANANGPVPVVIFGHGLMTESRFVLALGDALASRGFAAISIDFPYHGAQSRCSDQSVVEVIDPQTGKATTLPPCQAGSTCNEFGKCVDANGQGNNLAMWPVLNYPVASGAAFIEIDHIANTKDHFLQAVVDLSELKRSLQSADWSGLSVKLDGTKIYYAGQSLGGILGGSFLPYAPEIQRAVLNVPGADVVDLYKNSPSFGDQVTGFFTRQMIDPTSWQAARFLNLGRMMQDAVDPQSTAARLKDRKVFIQMATLDLVIPNPNTEILQTLSGAPRRDYVAEHGFIVIPVEPECLPGQADLGDFLDGSLMP